MKLHESRAVVVYILKPSTQKTEVDGSLVVREHPCVYRDFQNIQCYTEKHLNKNKNKNKKKH